MTDVAASRGLLRFHHGGVSVPDLEEAIGWYGDVLGFRLDRRFAVPGAEVAYVERDGLRIELFEAEGAAPLPDARRHPRTDLMTHGHKHLAFATEDYDRFRADLVARGIEVILDVGESFGRAFFIRDNSGNVIEFVEV